MGLLIVGGMLWLKNNIVKTLVFFKDALFECGVLWPSGQALVFLISRVRVRECLIILAAKVC